MLPISIVILGVVFCLSLAGIALFAICGVGFLADSPRGIWKHARIGAVAVLAWVALFVVESRRAGAATVNSDIALTGTFGTLGGSGTGSITSITGVVKAWVPFPISDHIDTVLSADPQIRNVVVSTPGIPNASASGLANLDYDNTTPGTPGLLRSLSVDLNGAGGNNKSIAVTGNNSANPYDVSVGILGTMGLVVRMNASITNLTFSSTAVSTAGPDYLIPGNFTAEWTASFTAQLVNVPLLGTINLGTFPDLLSDTLVVPGTVPGTMILSDLQGGAGPFPNDMLASFAAALTTSTPLLLSAPIVSDQTWTVPDGQDGLSSLRIRGNMSTTLTLSLSHNLNGTVQNALVPEPGSMVLMMIGAAGVIAVGYRRKHRGCH